MNAPDIPDHELIRRIGGGSYGDVWLARNVMGTHRAVKLVYRSRFDNDRPYEREFEGIRKFEPISRTHESQVDILHIGRNDAEGYFYYVMELADDANVAADVRRLISSSSETNSQSLLTSAATYIPKTLRLELQRRGRLPFQECLQLGLSLATALEHLHGHGLIHRDIKPSNIIFVKGRLKLADIGLVTETDRTMSFVGTAGYLPPEGPGTEQGDIYSLGKVLYEACTGKDRQEFPELPSALGALTEEESLLEFNEIVVRACHHDPRQRYASARGLLEDLSLLQAGKSVMEKRHRERLVSGAKKVAAILALALLVGTVGYFVRNPARPASLAPQRLLVDGAEFWRAPHNYRELDFSPRGDFTRIVFAGEKGLSVWDQKTNLRRPLKLRGLEGWLVGLRPALPRWAPDGQHFIFQAFKKIDGLEVQPLNVSSLFLADADTGECERIGPELAADEQAADLSWLPDGKSVTYISKNKRFYTLALATGARTLWVDSNLPPHQEAMLGHYSPDGKWLPITIATRTDVSKEERDIWLMPHPGGRAIPLTDMPGFDGYPTWGPDGETVYYVSVGTNRFGNTWGIWKVRIDPKTGLRDGPSVEVFKKHGQQLLHPRFVDSGRKLAYAGAEPWTRVWVANSDQMDQATELPRGQAPVLSPNGSTVYFVGETPEQQGVYSTDRDGKRPPQKLCDLVPLGDHFPRSYLSLSPDGDLIAMCSFDANTKKLGVFTIPTAGGSPHLVETLTDWELIVPVWSPDGQWLAYTVDKVLYRVSRDGKVREALASLYRWQGSSLRWSPDGKWLAALAYESPAHLGQKVGVFAISIADKQLKRLTPESEDKYKEGLDWHPDGQRLTYFFYGPDEFDAKIKWAFLNEPGKTEEMIDQDEHWDFVGRWSPDGQQFIFESSNLKTLEKGIHVYNAATRNITPRLRDGWLPEWSRDGRTAVWTTQETQRYFEVLEDLR